MGKQRSEGPVDLPLFDLPMDRGKADSPEPAVEPPATGKEASTSPEGRSAAAEGSGGERVGLAAAAASPRPVAVPAAEETRDSEEVPPGWRVAAGLADLVIQAALLGATLVVVMLMGVPLGVSDWPPLALLALVLSCVYYVVPLGFWGQTPGMTWIGLLSRARDNRSLTFRQTFLRWLGALGTVLLAGVPFLLALGGRPSLGDRLSATKTIAIRPRDS